MRKKKGYFFSSFLDYDDVYIYPGCGLNFNYWSRPAAGTKAAVFFFERL